MSRDGLIQYLKMLDANLKKPAKLYIYGGAALMLLEEETRISLDIDVAAPYSEVDYIDFQHACEAAGIPLSIMLANISSGRGRCVSAFRNHIRKLTLLSGEAPI